MSFLYRKIIRYPKAYTVCLFLLCFTAFTPASPYEPRFYFQLFLFLVSLFIFLTVYMKMLTSDFFFAKKIDMPSQFIKKNLRNSFLLSSINFLILPIIGLFFYDNSLIKFLCTALLLIFFFLTLSRRMSFKTQLSMERSIFIFIKNLFFAFVVSYLPFFIFLLLFF